MGIVLFSKEERSSVTSNGGSLIEAHKLASKFRGKKDDSVNFLLSDRLLVAKLISYPSNGREKWRTKRERSLNIGSSS